MAGEVTGHEGLHPFDPQITAIRADALGRRRSRRVAGEELSPVLLPDEPPAPDPQQLAVVSAEVELTNALPTVVPEGLDRPVRPDHHCGVAGSR